MKRGTCAWVLAASIAACGADSVPTWLDTSPPTVTPDPAPGSYNRVFSVTFTANERSLFFVSARPDTGFERLTHPFAVSAEGRTVLYYYGQDEYGNRSAVDSAEYVLDTRPPSLSWEPKPGLFPAPVMVRLSADEPCEFFSHTSESDSAGSRTGDALSVADTFNGYLSAVDQAGNRTMSPRLRYVVKGRRAVVSIAPPGGLFAGGQTFALSASEPCSLFYTLDMQALPGAFGHYTRPVRLDPGRSVVRFYGIDRNGWRTPIDQATFEVDTTPPQVRLHLASGSSHDTIRVIARGAQRVFYEVGEGVPTDASPAYGQPIAVRRQGRQRVSAFAVDEAGNRSDVVVWEQRYDFTAPRLTVTPGAGSYRRAVTVTFRTSELADVHYTLDGSPAGIDARIAGETLVISAQGSTTLRCVGIDEAGNASAEQSFTYVIDTVPPRVRVRIEGGPGPEGYRVYLSANEDGGVFYSVGGGSPSRYDGPIAVGTGQIVRYYAIDRAGNRSADMVLDELQRPAVRAAPPGGVYNGPVRVGFEKSGNVTVRARVLPDTVFRPVSDTILFDEGGTHVLEYYALSASGEQSAVRREEYSVDQSAPRVQVLLRRGAGDTAFVLFEASENATIYYTLDGSSPYSSPTVGTAGSRLSRSSDRIKAVRREGARLAFYAEDAAGNQSRLSVIDLYKPSCVPSVPDGEGIVYDSPVTLSLYSLSEGRIYYARHGATPTLDSAVFREPITLLRSDTVCAFVVDQTGTAGDIDTFVFMVDLPPSPAFTVAPREDSVPVGEAVLFDASGSSDHESPVSALRFRWDFDADSVWDTPYGSTPAATHAYARPGRYRPVVAVRDERNRVATLGREVLVRGTCPPEMVFVVGDSGNGYCIDRNEWTPPRDTRPLTGVSWVEAKMHCLDAGKRLCTAREWEDACRGGNRKLYPYGPRYEPERCATEGDKPHAVGSFERCGEAFGLHDMVGNVWEWVEDKQNQAPVQMGGSYRLGGLAHCGQNTRGRISTRSEDVGFRCCK